MRRTSPDLAAPDRTRPATAWQPGEVPTQRAEDTWRNLERRTASPAPVAATAAPQPRAHPSAYTSPDGSQWSWDHGLWQSLLAEPVRVRWWRSRAALVGALALLALLGGGWFLAASLGQGGTVTRAEREVVRGALQAAGIAQLSHHTHTLTYATSIDDLILLGLEPDPRVTVTIVDATDETFCLAAGPTGEEPTAWLTPAGESTTPCE